MEGVTGASSLHDKWHCWAFTCFYNNTWGYNKRSGRPPLDKDVGKRRFARASWIPINGGKQLIFGIEVGKKQLELFNVSWVCLLYNR
jgi:hypothetical protein